MPNEDEMKKPEKKLHDEGKGQAGKNGNEKSMKEGGTGGGLDEDTKHGLGKTEDKIRDRLKR